MILPENQSTLMDMSLEQAPDHYFKGNADIKPRKLTLNPISWSKFLLQAVWGCLDVFIGHLVSLNDTPFYDAKQRTCNHDTWPIMGMQRVLGHVST
jgi:hypothetical protein